MNSFQSRGSPDTDHGHVTVLSKDKVTQLEMLNSPQALAPVCHAGPILSAPPEGSTLFGLGSWEMFPLTCPLGASQANQHIFISKVT